MNIAFCKLDKSPFSFDIYNLKLYFSSEYYRDKFINEYEDYLDLENAKLSYRYRADVIAQELLILALYKSIERRGFRVLYKNKEITPDYKIKTIIEEA